MKVQSKAEELQRKAAVTAASCAVLAGIPALTMTHGLLWVGFVGIGVQVVLLALAIRYGTEARRGKAAEQK
jgi:hypothetical protein